MESMQKFKSPGEDGINEMIKYGGPKLWNLNIKTNILPL